MAARPWHANRDGLCPFGQSSGLWFNQLGIKRTLKGCFPTSAGFKNPGEIFADWQYPISDKPLRVARPLFYSSYSISVDGLISFSFFLASSIDLTCCVGQGGADGPGSPRMAQMPGDPLIGAHLSPGNSMFGPQDLLLKQGNTDPGGRLQGRSRSPLRSGRPRSGRPTPRPRQTKKRWNPGTMRPL